MSSRRFPRTASGLHRLEKALDELLAAHELPGRDDVVWLR
ncbi:hypothetical protein EV385_0171 [Krasilnikovia cinnamomea]|uniref:Uncharacterized protein n=1 Tax=Krasilnikovia cinnamomea TaxID=349313 RepID=A0A4Q7ZEF7_9ACTN|nr:hypothetical protein EV385_0171 [Krasilnikovia cinnamomea]